jgi:hypothetical protein
MAARGNKPDASILPIDSSAAAYYDPIGWRRWLPKVFR